MHYIFADERYSESEGHRTIVVAAWAVNQSTLNSNLAQLHLPGRALLLARVESALEHLNAVAFVGRATLAKSVFRVGEVDGCDDIPAMARPDTVWSTATVFVVAGVLRDLCQSGHFVDAVDLYLDPKSLKKPHQLAWEKTLRSLLVQEARWFASQLHLRSLEHLRIRHIRFVEKAKHSTPNKFQLGIDLADRLCSRSEDIFQRQRVGRISRKDISDVVARTVGQWDGVMFS